mgnify:CR=1 FL=1
METNMAGMKPEKPLIGIVIDCKNLNVREQPDGEADVLGTISADSEVLIDENEPTSEFYKVCTASGLEGFCMKKYIVIQS